MNQKPLISIIVAVYNRAGILQRCIDSVHNQTYPKKELIIIDGGSTDGTVDILQNNNDKITYWQSEPDRGIYHAWNKALDHASGDWIYFLGSDDYFWKPDVLDKIISHLIEAESQGIRVVQGQVALVTQENKVVRVVGESWECTRQKAIDGISSFPNQAIFHHRNLFEVHGRFDESFQIAGDYELLIRELKSADAYFIDKFIVAGMQIGGISSNNAKIYLKELAIAKRKNGLKAITILWLIHYAWALLRPHLKSLIGESGVKHLGIFGGRLIG